MVNYNNEENTESPYRNITESSPEISKTDQPSGSRYIDGDEDDMPSSSMQDSPSSPMKNHINLENPDLIANLNQKAM